MCVHFIPAQATAKKEEFIKLSGFLPNVCLQDNHADIEGEQDSKQHLSSVTRDSRGDNSMETPVSQLTGFASR